MLCPLLQSTAVKAIVNPNDHSASQPSYTHTQMHTDTHAHTLPSLRSRGPDKIGDGGDSSEDSTAGALHLLTDSYAWRSLKALPSHTLPAHGTHSNTQINRNTQMPTHSHIHPQCTYTTLISSSPPTSFLPSILSLSPPRIRPYPYPDDCPPSLNPSPPHSCPQLQNA